MLVLGHDTQGMYVTGVANVDAFCAVPSLQVGPCSDILQVKVPLYFDLSLAYKERRGGFVVVDPRRQDGCGYIFRQNLDPHARAREKGLYGGNPPPPPRWLALSRRCDFTAGAQYVQIESKEYM